MLTERPKSAVKFLRSKLDQMLKHYHEYSRRYLFFLAIFIILGIVALVSLLVEWPKLKEHENAGPVGDADTAGLYSPQGIGYDMIDWRA